MSCCRALIKHVLECPRNHIILNTPLDVLASAPSHDPATPTHGSLRQASVLSGLASSYNPGMTRCGVPPNVLFCLMCVFFPNSSHPHRTHQHTGKCGYPPTELLRMPSIAILAASLTLMQLS